MIFVVLFEDNPGTEHLRGAHMAAHLAFLESRGKDVAGAGPLFAPDGGGAGGMWLVEAETAEAVQAMVEADPFYPTGLRKRIAIREWRRVLRDGRRV